MKSHALLLLSFAMLLTLAGCGGAVSDALGLGRNPPDEFAVVDRAPLSVPPDFDLRPPKPGATRPQDVTAAQAASATLFGAAPAAADLSDSEKALLESTGAAHAQADIRELVDRDAAQKIVSSRTLVNDLLWWRDSIPPATIVDPTGEAARLKDVKAQGAPANQGATPVIEKEKSGWLGL